MKTIVFLNGKGGTGKSASATTLSHIIATVHGKRTLLVDMDPQSNASAMYSDVNFEDIFFQIYAGKEAANKQLSVEDMLMDSRLDPHKCIVHTEYPNLDMIPAFLTLSEAEERMKADTRTVQQFKLKNQLDKIKEEYDICLVDCGPSISLLNINALAAADEVYIPTRSDGNSLIGIAITMNLVRTVQEYNPKLKIGGIFITQYSRIKNVSKTAYEILESVFPDEFLPITVGVTKNLEENSLEQKPLLELDKRGKVTKSYLELAEYIVAPNKRRFLEEYRKTL